MKSATNSSNSRFVTTLCLLGIAAWVTLVYAPTLFADFVNWDDEVNIYSNPYLTDPQGVHWKVLATQATSGFSYYIPLTSLLWGIIYQLSAADVNKAFLFHLTNLLFHLLNTMLVFGIIWKLINQNLKNRDLSRAQLQPSVSPHAPTLIASSLGALLFALHPLQVESVAWASELKGLLSAFFVLCGLHLFIGFVAQRRLASHALITLFYGAALLSKPTSVVFPILCWVVAVCFLRAPPKRTLADVSCWILIATPVVAATKSLVPVAQVYSPLWGRPFVASDALAFYITKFLFPLRLGVDYSRDPQWLLSHLFYLTWLPIPLLALALWLGRPAFARWTTKSDILFIGGAILIFVIALLPVLGIVVNVFQYYSTVADRYIYLPMVGFSLILALLIVRANQTKFKQLFNLATLAILIVLSFQSWQQVATWSDSKSLWTQSLAVNPNSWSAYKGMGTALSEENKNREAIPFYLKAIEIKPDSPEIHNDLGASYFRNGDLNQAIVQLTKVIELNPKFSIAHYNLANALFQQRRDDEARTHYAIALKAGINPPAIYFKLGSLAWRRGDLNDAANFYAQAARYEPASEQALSKLGAVLLRLGRKDEALAQWARVLQLNPNSVDARINAGVLYYQKGDLSNAKLHLSEAARLAPNSGEVRNLLEKINSQKVNSRNNSR